MNEVLLAERQNTYLSVFGQLKSLYLVTTSMRELIVPDSIGNAYYKFRRP